MRSVGLIILALALLQITAPAAYRLSNAIVAIVNESVITQQDVLQASAEAIDLYQRTYYNKRDVFEQKRISAMTEALDQLIDRQLVLADFESVGGVIPQNYIDDIIKNRIREQYGDRIRLTQTLRAQGVTFQTFRDRERDKIIMSFMENKFVREAVLVSPAKVERFYQTNLHRFQLDDQVKLRMIVLGRSSASTSSEAKGLTLEIKKKIEQGAPFEDMAAIYSEELPRRDGGLWGWVEHSKLKKGLSDIAFALEPAQCSPVLGLASGDDDTYWLYEYDSSGNPIKGRKFSEREKKEKLLEEKDLRGADAVTRLKIRPREFYLLTVDEKQPSRTRALGEVRGEIENDLLRAERARLHRKWIERLRAKSFVRYY